VAKDEEYEASWAKADKDFAAIIKSLCTAYEDEETAAVVVGRLVLRRAEKLYMSLTFIENLVFDLGIMILADSAKDEEGWEKAQAAFKLFESGRKKEWATKYHCVHKRKSRSTDQ
jgi:hypothetical protein